MFSVWPLIYEVITLQVLRSILTAILLHFSATKECQNEQGNESLLKSCYLKHWMLILTHLLTTSLSLNKVIIPTVMWILLGNWNMLASIPRHYKIRQNKDHFLIFCKKVKTWACHLTNKKKRMILVWMRYHTWWKSTCRYGSLT